MATRLSLYNAALRHCGQRALASAAEAVESRRVLDDAYDDALKFCLERGFWNFAIRTVEMTPDPVTAIFGYQFAYIKPVDWRRTLSLTLDGDGKVPARFVDEVGRWHCDANPVFARYVSDDASYGSNIAIWPQSFSEALSAYLAMQVVERLTQSDSKIERIQKLSRQLMAHALSRDAMDEPPGELPRGGWATSRSRAFPYDRSR